MNLLRSLKKNNSSPIFGNFRPVQPLYNRSVRASFHVSELNTSTTPTVATAANTTDTITTAGVPTDSNAGSSAVNMTASLFFPIFLAALFVHFF